MVRHLSGQMSWHSRRQVWELSQTSYVTSVLAHASGPPTKKKKERNGIGWEDECVRGKELLRSDCFQLKQKARRDCGFALVKGCCLNHLSCSKSGANPFTQVAHCFSKSVTTNL